MMKLYNCLALSLFASVFFSCEDVMDIHKDFIEGGEIIYAPKPDSIAFIAGKERIQFTCWTYNAPNVKTVDVYWNGGLDSLLIPVQMGTGRDSVTVILENMEEKSFTFDVRTTDNFGHKSLSVTNFGTAYGDFYQSTLSDRRVKELSLSDKGGTIDWYAKVDGLVRNEIRYVKKDGTEEIVFMPAEENSAFCPDVKPGSSFEYRSLFIPEEEAIDTFSTEWKKYETAFPVEYMYDRSDWSVLAVSDETASDGGGMNTLIDGNLGSYWHSQWDGGDAPLPHWAVIDMQTPKEIGKLDIYRRPGNTDAKTIEVYVSDQPDADADGWGKIGSAVFGDKDNVVVTIPESVDTGKGRYLKILLPDSNRDPFISIAEVFVYGR